MRLPFLFSSVPRATSSISAPRIGSRPPARSSASVLISMQPPAARCVRLFGIVDLLERVELGEEVDERGHDHPLPGRLRAEQGHLRDEGAVVVFRRPDQVAQRRRRPGDVRVGEQHVAGSRDRWRTAFRPGRGQTCCRRGPGSGRVPGIDRRRQALGHRPDLARPAVGPGAAGDDGQRRAAVAGGLLAQFGGDVGGAVVAPVIDQEDAELARGSPAPAASAACRAGSPPRCGRARRRRPPATDRGRRSAWPCAAAAAAAVRSARNPRAPPPGRSRQRH